MDKQNVLHDYTTLLCLKKEWNYLTHATMCGNLESVMLCETSQTPKTHSIWFYLYDVLRQRKLNDVSKKLGGGVIGVTV